MPKETATKFCPRCRQVLKADNFYKSTNTEKYPDGLLDVCKKCLTAHVDNWNADTYLPILEELNVPYVPEEWNKILIKVSKTQQTLTGMTVLGRYLSVMKLSQYRQFAWADTEFIQKKKAKEITEKMREQGYSAEEIDEVITTSTLRPPAPPKQRQTTVDGEMSAVDEGLPQPFPHVPTLAQMPQLQDDENPPPADYFSTTLGFEVENEMVNSLTEDDKKELCLKWGKSYRPEEWIRLEQLYSEMMESYDIQTAGHKDTLKLVCKTSLKANQLLDIGDKIYVPLKLS